MFTIKLYDGNKSRILEAESFTVHLGNSGGGNQPTRNWAEITLHNRDSDVRYDVGDSPMRDSDGGEITVYRKAYIENAAGKTVECFNYGLPVAA